MLASSAATLTETEMSSATSATPSSAASCWDPMPTPAHTPIQAASAITISDR